MMEVKEEIEEKTDPEDEDAAYEPENLFLSKVEIEEKVQGGAFDRDLVFSQNDKYKSGVWEKFLVIFYKGVKQTYVKCKWCNSVLSYKSKTGTASLLRHKCVSKKAKGRIKSEPVTKEPLIIRKQGLALKQLYFITKDYYFSDYVEGVGFKELAQCLINLGADYGKLSVNDVLSSNKYLLETLMPEKLLELKETIRNLIIENDLVLAVSVSSDRFERKCISLSGRVINSDYELKSFLLGIKNISTNNTKMSDYLLDILREYITNADQKINNSILVMDDDVKSMGNFNYNNIVPCSAYNIDKVVMSIFEGIADDILPVLTVIRDIAMQLKTSGVECKITSENIVNNTYAILEYYREISANPEFHKYKLSNIDLNLANSVYDFLQVFYQCHMNLKSDVNLTINNVCLWKKKLQNYCIVSKEDSEIIVKIKEIALDALNEHFKNVDVHKISVILNPNFKSLKFFSLAEKSEVYDIVQKYIIGRSKPDNGGEVVREKSEVYDIVQKYIINRSKPDNGGEVVREKSERSSISSEPDKATHFSELMDVSDTDNDGQETADEELFRYVNLKRKIYNDDVLYFWRNCSDFPNLKKLASRVLNVPACSQNRSAVFDYKVELRGNEFIHNDYHSLMFFNKNVHLLI